MFLKNAFSKEGYKVVTTLEILSNTNIKAFNDILANAQRVALFTHVNPDGDALGSTLAFQMVLKSKGIASSVFIADEVPETLNWLEGASAIHSNANLDDIKAYLRETDLIACLDFNEPGRTDRLSAVLEQTDIPVLVLDHHPQVKEYEGLQIATKQFSSTSELLYWLLKASNNLVTTKAFAECIYTGIVTDTGSFAYNASSPATFRAVAELLEIGFDKDRVTNLIFQQFDPNRIHLLGHMLANRMKVMNEYHTAYTYLTQKDLENFGFKPGDTEGFVNYPLSIAGVKFTALFIEKDDLIKISFRSKGNFAANEFSKRFFEGGGHQNAAGGKSYKPLPETLKHFEQLVKAHIHEF